MIKKYEFTKEEMIDFYEYTHCLASVALFEMIHHILETAEAEEVPKRFEAMEKDFRENCQRLQNKISKKVFETSFAISSASLHRALDELKKSKDSK